MGEGMRQEETRSSSNLSGARRADTGKKNCPGTVFMLGVGTSLA